MKRASPFRLALLLAVSMPHAVFAAPDDAATALRSSPSRCIALHRGQLCYLKATLQWTSLLPGDYCLHQRGLSAPLRCWAQSGRGSHTVDVKSAETLSFELRSPDGRVVAQADVEVAWVYNARRRSKANWRLF